ncbi:MAG: hypothetical protein KDA49_01550 [Rhodospirillaceae bacterium]|nr:hypothetical protein [Rhodospirillaceae bacterium]MCA8931120.1 hypothetical protein [Rhodospirillaceae bacterium]
MTRADMAKALKLDSEDRHNELDLETGDASPEERRALFREAYQLASLGGRTFREERLAKAARQLRDPED